MNSFGDVMALFWTLAEGAILLFVRWGLAALEGRRRGQRRVVAVCAALFALLVLLVVGGEEFFRVPLGLDRDRNLLVLFGLFGAYELLSLRVIESRLLEIPEIDNLASFYVKLSGFLWILFEWIVAVLGVRAFLVLRRAAGEPA